MSELTEVDADTVVATIRSLGYEWVPERVAGTCRALFGPMVSAQSSDGVTVYADLAYGPDPRQKLDIYRPDGGSCPLIMFVPGGGYRSGEKMDGLFYRNIGLYFARHGFVTAIPNYRLAPDHKWPAGAEDVAGALAYASAGDFGVDRERVFLFGHSAGATHVASYLFDPRFHPAEGAGVTAAVLMSGGGYSIGANPPAFRQAYFGEDPTQWEDRSPITHLANSKTPLFISLAEYDPGMLAAPSFELSRAVTLRDGKPPLFQMYRDHNHISTVYSIGSQYDEVGSSVRDFLGRF